MGLKYYRKPEEGFTCHMCDTRQKYGTAPGLEFTIIESDSDDNDEDDITDSAPLQTIGGLRKGDAVYVQHSPKDSRVSAWLSDAVEIKKKSTRRTRAATRRDWYVQVVYKNDKTFKVQTWSTLKVLMTPRVGPTFNTQLRIDGEYTVTKTLSSAQNQRCEDLTLGAHPPKEVLINKFNTLINYNDIGTLRPGEWLNDEIVNFYMQVRASHSTCMPHILHMHASHTPHAPLEHSSHTPHAPLEHSSHTPHALSC